jgi:hypothetical protein
VSLDYHCCIDFGRPDEPFDRQTTQEPGEDTSGNCEDKGSSEEEGEVDGAAVDWGRGIVDEIVGAAWRLPIVSTHALDLMAYHSALGQKPTSIIDAG